MKCLRDVVELDASFGSMDAEAYTHKAIGMQFMQLFQYVVFFFSENFLALVPRDFFPSRSFHL